LPPLQPTPRGYGTSEIIAKGVESDPVVEAERPHPPSFYCPISHQCMHDPVILTDGHTYERRHIEQWLQTNDKSPVSGIKLTQTVVFPNHALRNAIEEYFEQVLGDHRLAIKHAISGLQQRGISTNNTTLLHTINSLMQCSILVNADLSIEHVLTKIMQEAKSLVGAEVASVFLVDRKRSELYSTVNSTGGELRIPIKSGVAGSVAYSGMPDIIQDAYKDCRFNTAVDSKTGFKTRNILCVPIKAWKGRIIGVAQLINKTSVGITMSSPGRCAAAPRSSSWSSWQPFTLDDQQFLEVLAAQAGAAIVNSGMFESMPGVSGKGRWPSPPRCKSTPSLQEVPAAVSRSSTLEDISKHMPPTLEPCYSSVAFMEEEKLVKEGPCATSVPCAGSTEDKGDVLSAKQLRMLKPLLSAAADNWEMDVLSLAELSENKPLSTLGLHLFQHHELTSFFDMDAEKLQKFLLKIERGYPTSNQYHNRSHGASVLHCMHCLLSLGGVAEASMMAAETGSKHSEVLEDHTRRKKLVLLAGLLAAIVHDFEHEGVSNDFLVKSSNDRAILYNDKSPNENHHVAAAWFVLQRSDCNFLENLTVKEFGQLRRLIVQLVLSTDMAEHGSTLNKFKEVAACSDASTRTDGVSADSGDFTAACAQDAVVVLQLALKCSDLGHLSLSWSSHMRWVQRLEAEFFAQGDQEKKLGMPDISFLMDRQKEGASDTQVGFFDFVVLPLFRAMGGLFPLSKPMVSKVEANYESWKEVQAQFLLSAAGGK